MNSLVSKHSDIKRKTSLPTCNTNTKAEKFDVLNTFMRLVNTNMYSTQQELAIELNNHGFNNVTQAQVSRLLKKTGAIKRYSQARTHYQLPNKYKRLQPTTAIKSAVLNITHNKVNIVLKTVKGGATLVGKMIDSIPEEYILGCITSDSTILIIPSDTKKIENTIAYIKNQLNMDTLLVR
ncbi:MAG: hypothetical protein QF552_03560 [Litorilituus sp.]|jgi:arginine repressor|nr:hypothetical protein [Litorilituus sp.]